MSGLHLGRSRIAAEDAAEALRFAAAMLACSWDGSLDNWATADEVAHQLDDGRTAQQVASRLAMWERRGLVESKREFLGASWKMWRPSHAIRDALGQAAAAPTDTTEENTDG